MSARVDLGGDFIEMPLPGLGVAAGQDQSSADTARGTDGAEDIGRFRALVLERHWPASAWCPAPRELGFLADPGLILPPKLYVDICREPGADIFQLAAKVF